MTSDYESAYYQPVVFDDRMVFGSNAPGFSFFADVPQGNAWPDYYAPASSAPFDYYQPHAAWSSPDELFANNVEIAATDGLEVHSSNTPRYYTGNEGTPQNASGYFMHDQPRFEPPSEPLISCAVSDEAAVRGATKDSMQQLDEVRQHFLSSVQSAMSEEREFFNLRRPLYVQRIKQAMFMQPLKSVVIPLTATMPVWPISSVERSALMALRSADPKTLIESPLLIEVMTSLVNKLLVLLCLQWGSALISSHIKRQMTQDLISLVTTQRTRELEAFVHKFVLQRCRYFRDVIVRQSKRDDQTSASEAGASPRRSLSPEPVSEYPSYFTVPVS